MSETFSRAEYQLYARQMILPELGQSGQYRLRNAHAVVIGAGGLGAPALLYLAGAGVGTITVIDDDHVELSNLHRQVIHAYSRQGNSKAESAADTLRALNPLITVRTVKERLTHANAAELLDGVSVVLDGSDNFETRYVVSAACARAGIAHIWGAILGFDAQLSVFWHGRGPIYEDLYPVQPAEGTVPNCATAGVIGALAGVAGTTMAMEAIKVITGIGTPLIGEVAYYSGISGKWEYIPLTSRVSKKRAESEPQQAFGHFVPNVIFSNNLSNFETTSKPSSRVDWSWTDVEAVQNRQKLTLIDVREPAEFAALTIPTSRNIPLSHIQQWKQQNPLELASQIENAREGNPVVLFCSAGPRSALAVQWLTECGLTDVHHLSGGLVEWLNRKV